MLIIIFEQSSEGNLLNYWRHFSPSSLGDSVLRGQSVMSFAYSIWDEYKFVHNDKTNKLWAEDTLQTEKLFFDSFNPMLDRQPEMLTQ